MERTTTAHDSNPIRDVDVDNIIPEDRQAKVDAVLRTNLSADEVERRLNLCPDCLQYDGAHVSNCENEDNPEPGRWEQLRRAVLDKLPEGSAAEVSEWVGCDEDWGDPVYVIARDPDGEPYVDAVCDLDATSVEAQAVYVVDQLIHG